MVGAQLEMQFFLIFIHFGTTFETIFNVRKWPSWVLDGSLGLIANGFDWFCRFLVIVCTILKNIEKLYFYPQKVDILRSQKRGY